MKNLILLVSLSFLSLNIYAQNGETQTSESSLESTQAAQPKFSAAKLKSWEKYRSKFYDWMKAKSNKEYNGTLTKSFSQKFKANMSFIIKRFRPLMIRDAFVQDARISDNELIEKLYDQMNDELMKEVLTAMKPGFESIKELESHTGIDRQALEAFVGNGGEALRQTGSGLFR